MPDVFDQIAPEQAAGDVFDQVAPDDAPGGGALPGSPAERSMATFRAQRATAAPAADVFDQIAPEVQTLELPPASGMERAGRDYWENEARNRSLGANIKVNTGEFHSPDEPNFTIVPTLTEEDKAKMLWAPPAWQKAAGVIDAAAENVNALTSDRNLVLLGAGVATAGVPFLARGMAAAFAVAMGKEVPAIASELGKEYAKPEAERDHYKIGKLITQGLITTGFSALAGAGAVKPGAKAAPPPRTEDLGLRTEPGTPKGTPLSPQSSVPSTKPVSEFGGERELASANAEARVANEPAVTGDVFDLAAAGEDAGSGALGDRALPTKQGPSVTLRNSISDLVREDKDVPHSLIEQYNADSDLPWVAPEGYAREGEAWKFTEPAERLTPEQQTARDAVENMQEFRARKGAAAPDEEAAPSEKPPYQPTERVEPGVPMEWMDERPPDLLDFIHENVTTRGVRLPEKADFGDYVSRARGRAREMLSTSKGMPADQVIRDIAGSGQYKGIETPDDLAEAMVRAGEARIGWREQQRGARDALAEASAKAAAESPTEENTGTKPSGFKPPAMPERFDTLDDALKYREAYKQSEMEFYKSLGLDEKDALKLFRAGDARSQLDVSKIEDKLTPENLARLDQFATGEGSQMYHWDRQYDPEELSHETDKAELSRSLVQNLTRESLPTDFGDKLIHASVALRKLKEQGGSWSDIASELDKFTTRNSSSQGDKADVFKTWGEKIQKFAEQQGIELPQGEMGTERLGEGPELTHDQIENWFDDAIEATNPLKAGLMEGVSGAPVWLGKSVAHGALRVAKLAYTTTRDLARAISAAVEHVRAQGLPGFDEDSLRHWITNVLGERETGQKILDSESLSDGTKAAVTEYLYERRGLASDDAIADELGEQFTPEQLEGVLRNPPAELPQMVWSRLLGKVTRDLAEQEKQARQTGDAAGAAALADRQGKLWNDLLPRITDMAQGLAGLRDMVDMSPDAQVARANRRLQQGADDKINRRGQEVEIVRQAVNEGRADGIEQVKQDPAVNDAARAAVDEAVGKSPETHKAIVMELAEPWASSPEIVRMIRAKVSGDVGLMSRLGRQEKPIGVSARQHLRVTLDDLAQRAATIFTAHVQGAEPNLGIVDKLKQRLGLDQAHAQSVATALSKEWVRQVELAKAKIPKRIAAQRVARDREAAGAVPEGATDNQLDRAIRTQLRNLRVKLGEALNQETAQRDQTGEHVAERVVKASGLEGEKADTLRTALRNRWDNLVTAAQVAKLKALQKTAGRTVSAPMRSAFEKLVKLNRLGALTGDQFLDVVSNSLKVKRSLTETEARTLRGLVQKAMDQPEGFLRQEAAANVLKFTEDLKGRRMADYPMAMFYANALSGLTTMLKIPLENTANLAASTVATLLGRPADVLAHPVSVVKSVAGAYKRGLAKGALQAARTLQTGVASGLYKELKTPSLLERKPFGDRWEALNYWKWFGRAVATTHEVTFKPAWELKQTMLARDVAIREGLRGSALEQRVADLMANTDERWDSAKAQALKELGETGTKLLVARRAREILEQEREKNMPGSTEIARDYGLRATYLNEPYGALGLLADGFQKGMSWVRSKRPWLGTGIKTQIPFVTVVTNILNEGLNWGPGGLYRAGKSHWSGELYGRPIMDRTERAEMYAKGIAGTVALGTLAYFYGDHFHGNGPSDPKKRKQLEETGWIPNSFEWKGRYYSMDKTPMKFYGAVLGNLQDWQRYAKGDEADGYTRFAYTVKATAATLLSQGMLDEPRRMLEALGDEHAGTGSQKLEQLAARTASTMVIPNLMQQIDRIWDPKVYDKNGVKAVLLAQVPFVRQANRPVLNILGEPIERGPFHLWTSEQKPDALWQTIAEKQAWIPEPDKNQIIGNKKLGPEYVRAMTSDERYQWIKESGPAIRERLTEHLDDIREAEPDEAKKIVQKIANEERARVKKELFE